MSQPGEITQLLIQLRNEDRNVEDQLIPLVYEELRRLARYYMRRERPNHTLQPTALVNEVCGDTGLAGPIRSDMPGTFRIGKRPVRKTEQIPCVGSIV
jgi:hypothetical protein